MDNSGNFYTRRNVIGPDVLHRVFIQKSGGTPTAQLGQQ